MQIVSSEQRLRFRGVGCREAVLLYLDLHERVARHVTAYGHSAEERFWFCEGLLAQLYKLGGPGAACIGSEGRPPQAPDAVCGYWEGILTAGDFVRPIKPPLSSCVVVSGH